MKHKCKWFVFSSLAVCTASVAWILCSARAQSRESTKDQPVFITHRMPPIFAPEDTVSFDLTVVNPRRFPVKILRHDTSCGCFVASVPESLLKSGESAVMSLQLRGVAGRLERAYQCRLYTDDPISPIWTYSIIADTYPAAMVAPSTCFVRDPQKSTVLHLSAVCYGDSGSELATLTEVTPGSSLELQQIAEPEIHRLENNVTRKSYAITLSLKAKALVKGNHSDQVECRFAGAKPISVPVVWTIPFDVDVRPSRIFFSNSAPEYCRRTLQLTTRDGSLFTVEGVDTGFGGPKHEVFDATSARLSHQLFFYVDRKDLPKSHTGSILITIGKGGEQRSVSVPFTVLTKQNPSS